MRGIDIVLSECASSLTVLQCCESALRCPAGAFYPNKDFGGRIASVLDKNAALAAARQALCDMDGVFVKSAEIQGESAVLTLMINDEAKEVKIDIEKNI